MENHLSSEQNYTQGMLSSGSASSVHYAGPAPLSPKEFDYFSRKILSQAGIVITRDKISMLEGRLRKRLKALGLSHYSEYQRVLNQDASGRELGLFVNSLTTNKTEFFREPFHFEHLQEVLQRQVNADPVYIWSAACSSGEEVYSLAILCENLKLDYPLFDYRILGTDINTERLLMSEDGLYENQDILNVPPMDQQKYFEVATNTYNNSIKVNPRLRQRVKFRQYNLIDDNHNLALNFNFIFLRNVLFYFSKETAEKIVRKLVRRLEPNGLFFISLTESLHYMDVGLTKVGASIYQKKESR